MAIFVAFGLALSPVLYKLTDTISTDSVDSMSHAMFAFHLLSHNYATAVRDGKGYKTSATSLNAALFSAVCLASRLDSSFDAFVLLSSAVTLFLLFPLLRSRVEDVTWLFRALVPLTLYLSFVVSLQLFVGVGLTLTFVTGVAPWLFLRWQRCKNTIHGPWDEAVPYVRQRSN